VAPKGQWEAARVLGLTKAQTFIRVILPPSLRRIYPALVSQCIIVMLGSSVVSQVSYEELTFAANLIQSRTFLSFEVYLVTTLLYLALSLLMRQVLMAADGSGWGARVDEYIYRLGYSAQPAAGGALDLAAVADRVYLRHAGDIAAAGITHQPLALAETSDQRLCRAFSGYTAADAALSGFLRYCPVRY
jgi:hypothetical protein